VQLSHREIDDLDRVDVDVDSLLMHENHPTDLVSYHVPLSARAGGGH
jgi:hypothetical protein